MDEGRLKAVRKSQRLHRKFAHAINDTIRHRQEYYQSCLSREEQEARARLVSKVMSMRRAVVRNRVLLQCLSLQRQNPPDRAQSEPLLGSYGGRPIDSYSKDIDQTLAWFHPKLRRLRKVDRIKQSCLKHGAILDEETVREKMTDFFINNLSPEPPKESDDVELTLDGANKTDKDNNNDDDDDFDIKNYPNPLGAAKIRLRLHPFGNMVAFDNEETNSKGLQAKRNIFGTKSDKLIRRVFETSDHTRPSRNVVATSGINTTNAGERNKSPSHKTKIVTAASPTKKQKSPRLSKYSEPLPPITSMDPGRDVPKNLSQTVDTEIKKSKHQDKVEQEKEHDKHHSLRNATPQTLRLSHVGKVKADSKGDGGSQESGAEHGGSRSPRDKRNEDRPVLTRRKTLILPPIETSRDMIKKK